MSLAVRKQSHSAGAGTAFANEFVASAIIHPSRLHPMQALVQNLKRHFLQLRLQLPSNNQLSNSQQILLTPNQTTQSQSC